jgi:UDP-glucose 4-epimerase
MKVLITGVAGLLGSRLAEHMLKTKPDVQVFGIDDLSGGYLENIPKAISHSNSFFLHADVNNVHTMEKNVI